MMLMAKNGRPIHISKKTDPKLKILGEATGFLKIQKKDALVLAKALKDFVKCGKTGVEYEETYNILMQKRKLAFENIKGFFWTEMDFEKDLRKIVSAQVP